MRGRLGPYDIIAPLGSGGMGEVYRARDSRLHRDVAVKVIKGSILNKPSARARFDREAQAIAALEHPHICKIYDVGTEGDIEYFVMQYLEGETLATRLQSGALPIADALKYGSQIAHAIDAAHRAGVAHRDLKPSNVMITKSGAVLLDFGLAKFESSNDAADVGSTATVDITGDGVILGTVRYMSPEALEHRPTDTRSDLFSFGALFYEMVTGHRAFDGASDAGAIAAILKEQPRRLRELRPDAPPELESVIDTCLAKDPEHRWQSAHDVAKQIDAIAGSRSATPAPISSGTLRRYRAKPRWAAAAAMLGTIAVAAASYLFMGWPSHATLAAPPPHVVALPCAPNASRAICDGLTEALIGRLVRLTQSHDLQVTPQIGGFTGAAKNVDDARRLLGATRVVQLKADGNIWTLTMSGAADGGVVATQQLDQSDGVFELEERATAWIVRALGLELTPVEREALTFRATKSGQSQFSYLEGRGLLLSARDAKDFDAAISAFSASIANDSSYAAAHVGVGMAWRGKYLRDRDAIAGANAREACSKALHLQPNLGRAHTCLGMLLSADRQLEQAAAELARAIEADPTDDDAVVWLGRTQEELHMSAEAERTYRAAIDARPRYFNPRLWSANFYRRQGRYSDAVLALQAVIALIPDHARMRANVAMPLMYLGRYDEALSALDTALLVQTTQEALVARGMTLFRMRRYRDAAETMERARSLPTADFTTIGSLARAYYWVGTPDTRARADALFKDAIRMISRELANPSSRYPKADLHIAYADASAKLGNRTDVIAHLSQVGLNVDDTVRPTDPHQLFFAALVYSQIGDQINALKWLGRAVFWGVPRAELRAWPELDPLRSDRAFQSLTRSD
jgi:tetratricopeptide (TPR) repeat protein